MQLDVNLANRKRRVFAQRVGDFFLEKLANFRQRVFRILREPRRVVGADAFNLKVAYELIKLPFDLTCVERKTGFSPTLKTRRGKRRLNS